MKQSFHTFIGYGYGFELSQHSRREHSIGIILDREKALKIRTGNHCVLIGYTAKYKKGE